MEDQLKELNNTKEETSKEMIETVDSKQATDDSVKVSVPNKQSKKKLVICILAAIIVVAGIVTFVVLHKSEFEKVQDECIGIAGFITGGGDYFTLDTDPDDWENMDSSVKALLIGKQQTNTLEAIKYANEALGFNGSLYSKMMESTALMGRQTEENDKYRVSWKYHPDDGLEVTYEKK